MGVCFVRAWLVSVHRSGSFNAFSLPDPVWP